MTKKVSSGTELITHYRDVLSHIEWVNRRDQLRYIGSKLEKKLIPVATLAGLAAVASSFVYDIDGGILLGAFIGLATAAIRYPNVLFGNGRYHAFNRRQYEAIKTYALTKICDRIVSIKDITKDPSTKLTPEQLKYIQKINLKIMKNLSAIERRKIARKNTVKYEQIEKKTEEYSRNLKGLKIQGIFFNILRKAHLDQKIKYLIALRKAKNDLKDLLGPVFAKHLVYLVDPNEEKIPFNRKEEFETTRLSFVPNEFARRSETDLFIPLEELEDARHWDPRVIDTIQENFNRLDDFSNGLEKIFEERNNELAKLSIVQSNDSKKRKRRQYAPKIPSDPLTRIIRGPHGPHGPHYERTI